jgi:hypothetical protein
MKKRIKDTNSISNTLCDVSNLKNYDLTIESSLKVWNERRRAPSRMAKPSSSPPIRAIAGDTKIDKRAFAGHYLTFYFVRASIELLEAEYFRDCGLLSQVTFGARSQRCRIDP